jgi:rare lipoprotein A
MNKIYKTFKSLNKEKMSMIKQNHLTQFTAVTMLAVLLGCGMAQAKEKPHNKGDASVHQNHSTGNKPKKSAAKKKSNEAKIAKFKGYTVTGLASYYGARHHGRETASGQIFDMYAMTAAHKSLPLHAHVRVTNLKNNKSVIVVINDRGPYVGDRILDLSQGAAEHIKLSPGKNGAAMVRIEVL